ncbi:MAG: hypothetical protein WD873_02885 [Candidatus Hydrogenedentales bacterium]
MSMLKSEFARFAEVTNLLRSGVFAAVDDYIRRVDQLMLGLRCEIPMWLTQDPLMIRVPHSVRNSTTDEFLKPGFTAVDAIILGYQNTYVDNVEEWRLAIGCASFQMSPLGIAEPGWADGEPKDYGALIDEDSVELKLKAILHVGDLLDALQTLAEDRHNKLRS